MPRFFTIGAGPAPAQNVPLGPVANPGPNGYTGNAGPQAGTLTLDRQPVPWVEAWDGSSPVIRNDNGVMTVERSGFAAWSQWVELQKCLIGYAIILPGTSGSPGGNNFYISRQIPEPAFNGYHYTTEGGFVTTPHPFLWCSRCSIRGLGCPPSDDAADGGPTVTVDPFGGSFYHNAKVTANFSAPNYGILTDAQMFAAGYLDDNGNPDEATGRRYIEKHNRPSVRYQTLPEGSFVFVSDGAVVPSVPGKLELTFDFSLKWFDVPEQGVPCSMVNPVIAPFLADGFTPYVGAIEHSLGGINDRTFFGQPKGTLLYTACTLTPRVNFMGIRVYDVEHMFQLFTAASRPQYAPGVGNIKAANARGHVLILRTDAPNTLGILPGLGYEEIVAKSSLGWLGSFFSAIFGKNVPTSNWNRSPSQPSVNLFDYHDFRFLLRVPRLLF